LPRLSPGTCSEERITLGTYERTLLKEYIQLQRDKQFNENLTKISTTTITGLATVAASIPLIVGAWIAKESIDADGVKNTLSNWWSEVKESKFPFGLFEWAKWI